MLKYNLLLNALISLSVSRKRVKAKLRNRSKRNELQPLEAAMFFRYFPASAISFCLIFLCSFEFFFFFFVALFVLFRMLRVAGKTAGWLVMITRLLWQSERGTQSPKRVPKMA